MPIFYYKARKRSGELETGSTEAPNQDALINTLQQRELLVLSISQQKIETASTTITYKIKYHSGISSKDVILFTTQVAATLKANIPLLKCIEIQIQQTTSRKFKTVLEDVRDGLRQGNTLKDSLAKYPKIFGPMWLNLIETGETSGQLPAVLEHLGEYQAASADLKRKTMTALIYPSILICVSLLAIYVFAVKIIPIFIGIFKDFKMELPFITKMVIGISDLLRANIILTIITLIAIIFGTQRYIRTEKGKKVFDTLIFKIPIFGNFILNTMIEKFTSSLSILLHSGIPILQALDIVAKTTGNVVIQNAVKTAFTDVRDGKPLSSSLAKSQILPPLAVSMCSVGEETGELDKMLDHVTKYYKKEVDIFVERLSAVLEPIVIVVMGGIVFVLVLAMYLPIFQIALLGGGKH